MKSTAYSIIGYAYGGSGNIAGTKDGPTVLRNRNLLSRLQALGVQVFDLGDISPQLTPEEEKRILAQASTKEKGLNNIAQTVFCCKTLATKVTQALENKTVPLILGGDHSLSIGSVSQLSNFHAAKGEKIGLLWVDTHADINTPDTTPSKNIFGMPVAFLLGLIPGALAGLQQSPPAVQPENVVYVGLRDLDPEEKTLIKKLGIRAFTMKDIDLHGMARVAEQAITAASKDTAGFVVSFDLDACDPRIVPGTGTPCRGGLTFRESHLLLELIYDAEKTLAFEMVELNPTLDKNFQTADLAVSLIESVCGKSIL